MAMLDFSGEIKIELSDVYVWLDQAGFTKGAEIASMSFSVADDGLRLVRRDQDEPILVDAVDLWTWVTDMHIKPLADMEILYGVPKVVEKEHALCIRFIASNHKDPREEPDVQAGALVAEWTGEREREQALSRSVAG